MENLLEAGRRCGVLNQFGSGELLSDPPECWFSFASFLAVESPALLHFCIHLIFMFSEMLH